MLDEVYTNKLRTLAAEAPHPSRISAPDASVKAYSKLCGSTITVDLVMRNGKVTDFALDVKACTLANAASAIMARNIVGSTADELRELRHAVWRMLKEKGQPPAGKWAEVAILEPVRDLRMRHSSTLLVFDAVVDAIKAISMKNEAKLTH